MTRALTTYWAWVVSLATIVGAYFAARPLGLERWLFAILGVAAVLTLLPTVIRKGRWALERVQNYDALLRRVGALQETTEAQTAELDGLRSRISESFSDGIEEGQKQVLGTLLAQRVEQLPSIVGLSHDENARLILVASITGHAILPGMRFEARVEATGDRRGIVEVVTVDRDNATALMRCVDRTVPEFWDALQVREPIDARPPEDTVLGHLVYALPQSLAAFGAVASLQLSESFHEKDIGEGGTNGD